MLNKNFGRPRREPSVRSVRAERAVEAIGWYSDSPTEANLEILRQRVNQLTHLDHPHRSRWHFSEGDDTD